MARSPLGVAIGVLGAVQTHCAQPSGHVPLSVGGKQAVRETPKLTWQQSSPSLQHSDSQQVAVPEQVTPWQGGWSQVPLLQNGVEPGHTWPHAPQFLMSLPVLTHSEPQQVKAQFESQVPPPVPAVEPPAPASEPAAPAFEPPAPAVDPAAPAPEPPAPPAPGVPPWPDAASKPALAPI